MTNIVKPFFHRRQRMIMGDNKTTRRVEQIGTEIVQMIPAEIEDSYHMLNTVMEIRNVLIDLPDLMTLGRFRYLISQYVQRFNLKMLNVLDPFYECSDKEQQEMLQYIDKDVFENFHNTIIMCVARTVRQIQALPLSPQTQTVRFTDKQLATPTPYGILMITFRLYTPESVTSERRRQHYLRMIAACSDSISVRSALLLQDPKFPLAFIPGIQDDEMLEQVALGVPDFTLDNIRF